jgi:hypothetical protein
MKEQKELREELYIVIPFFVFSLVMFLGSFNYRFESRIIPLLIGALAVILTGMRLIYIIFPTTKIGKFGEAGLAGEFDELKEKIEEQTLKGHYEEVVVHVTFQQEKKAFVVLLAGALTFFLFGYMTGGLLVIVGSGYYYGYKEKLPLFVSLVVMFFIVYVLLIKLLDGPMYYGLLLEPVLRSFKLL